MDDLELPEDLGEVEVIYSDGEGDEGDLEEEVDEMADYEGFPAEIEDVAVIDLAKLTFTRHTKSVFSCDMSRNSELAVTGGEDDSAYVWSTDTGEVLFECTGHKDSVTEVCFNHDNQLLATADMAGMIQVWNVKDKKLIWCYEGDDMEWLTWHPVANVLASGSQSGDIFIWQVPQGNCKILPSHGSPCTCGIITPDGKRLIAGYTDGQVKLWDMKAASTTWQLSEPQTEGITSLDVNTDGTLISVAPSAAILRMSDGKPTATLLVDGEKAIETHLFNSELGVFITGSLSGQLCVWDIGRQAIRHQAKIECAVTVLKMGPNGKAFVGATDGAVYVCDVRTGTLFETLTGHKADILSLCVSENGNRVLTTSDDGTAKIFQ